jgi:hypothetical protein
MIGIIQIAMLAAILLLLLYHTFVQHGRITQKGFDLAIELLRQRVAKSKSSHPDQETDRSASQGHS